jgi:hypothetical protein
MNDIRRDLNGCSFCDNPLRNRLMKLLYRSKGFIHIRTECFAAAPDYRCTLQARWDRGLKAESFMSKDVDSSISFIYARTGGVTYITAFKKGSVAKRLDLMGSPASSGRESSSSCLRRC